MVFATEILFIVSVNLTKLSILTFYRRIFPMGLPRYLHILIWMGIVATLLVLFGSLGAAIFQCWPISSFWDYSIDGQCLPTYPTHLVSAIINSVTDFYCVIIPLGEIWSLNMVNKRDKLIVASCFALGGM